MAYTKHIEGSGGGCFAEKTKVLTPSGEVFIEEIKVGDIVISFGADGKLVESSVAAVFVHNDNDIWEYHIWGGIVLQATPNHWVVNQYNAFACIGTLTNQDMFVDGRGHLRPFLTSTYIGRGTVYNLHVSNNCTFIANSIRVHNGGIDESSILGKKGGGKGGGGGGGGGGNPYREDPDTLQTNVIASLLEVVSCGVIRGLVNGGRSIYVDKTPIISDSGSYNFPGISWQFRDGTHDQSIMSGFYDVRSDFAVGIEVLYNYPITRRIVTPDISAIIVRVGLPNGLFHQVTDAYNPALVGTEVEFNIDVSTNGGPFVTRVSSKIEGKTMSAYARGYYIPLSSAGHWDVRVVRTSEPSTMTTLQNKISFDGYTLVSGTRINYGGTALMAYTVNAKDFGSSLPSRIVDMYGIYVKIPTNYNPNTRTYSGVWDGTFKTGWTDNPAWFIWWMLTDTENGIGEAVPDWARTVTKMELYQISKYCDEYVDNGFGGMEPRFTFNAWIVDRQKAFDYLRLICGTFRTQVFWGSGCIAFSQDRPQAISRVFTAANVIDGNFTYTETALSARHSVCEVSWHDPNDFCRAAIEVVEDAEMLIKVGMKKLELPLIGCTSRGQAHRAGAFALFSEKFESDIVTFSIGLAECDILPGQVVGIADPDYAGVSFAGRMVQMDGRVLTLDRTYAFKSSENYQIMMTLGDGQMDTVSIINPMKETDKVTITRNFNVPPVSGALWAIVSTSLNPRPFRVLSIAESSPLEFTITALQHDPRKYDMIEKGYRLELPPYSILPTGPLPSPKQLRANEYTYVSGSLVKSGFLVSWTPVSDTRVNYYEVEIKSPGDVSYYAYGITSSASYDFKDSTDGLYNIRVRSVSGLGTKSVWTEIYLNAYGKQSLPTMVQNFYGIVSGEYIVLHWDHVKDTGIKGYEIRIGRTWETGTTILFNVTENTARWEVPLDGTYQFLIKAVDEYNHYSLTATSTIVTADIERGLNIIYAHEEIPENVPLSESMQHIIPVDNNSELVWVPGLTNAYKDVGSWTNLSLRDYAGGDEDGYYITRIYDVDRNTRATLRSVTVWYAESFGVTNLTFPKRTNMVHPQDTNLYITSTSNIKTEYKVGYQKDDEVVWTEWLPQSAIVNIHGRYIQFRVSAIIEDKSCFLSISSIRWIIDVDDINIILRNESIPMGGKTFYLDNIGMSEIYTTYYVGVTALGTLGKYPVVEKFDDRFVVRVFESTGEVGSYCDINVRGY